MQPLIINPGQRQNVISEKAKYAQFSNENVGYIANLDSTGGFVFWIPFPATMNYNMEYPIIQQLQFGYKAAAIAFDAQASFKLNASISYADAEYDAAFAGNLDDVNDEAQKSKFIDNIRFGQMKTQAAATAAAEVIQIDTDLHQDAIVIPPFDLPMNYPLQVEMLNESQTVALLTGAETRVDNTVFERFTLSYWYLTRARPSGFQMSVPEKLLYRNA